MKAIIFNSGTGNRMGQLTLNRPKCMIPLYNGESIFERQIRILGECGIREFVVTTGPFEEQLRQTAAKFKDYQFTFVPNPEFDRTNYIVSMDNAYAYLEDDFLFLHGDLVFNRRLVRKVLENPSSSVCLFHEKKKLPKKDFKGRFQDGRLLEVRIDIFEEDCFAFQPFYKLDRQTLTEWKERVREFVRRGITHVYAENALNEIIRNLNIRGMSYADDYMDEIDNQEDYERVSREIKFFDYREQEICVSENIRQALEHILEKKNLHSIFVVSGRTYREHISTVLKDLQYECKVFSEFTPNPRYEDIKKGVDLFAEGNYDMLLAIGGGSAIDTAKCIKILAGADEKEAFLSNSFSYSRLPFLAIPTTAGSGSEATRFAVMYYKGEKQSITHDCLLPQSVILNAGLLKTVPDYQKKSTFLDALCQAIESYWARGATAESRDYAGRALKLIKENYQGYFKNEEGCLKQIMQASNLAGKAINISMTTAPHAMSYKLTSLYHIGHGHAVALTLPYVWELIAQTGSEETKRELLMLAKMLGLSTTKEAIQWYRNLFQSLELRPVAIREEDIRELTDSVNEERLKNTPVPMSGEQIEKIYRSL